MAAPARDHTRISLDDGGGERQRRCADVLYGLGSTERAAALLERYPGCLLVSLREPTGRCVTLSRTGRRIVVTPVRDDLEHAALASLLHQWLAGLSSRPAHAAGRPAAGNRPD
jgi:hypothetical protein